MKTENQIAKTNNPSRQPVFKKAFVGEDIRRIQKMTVVDLDIDYCFVDQSLYSFMLQSKEAWQRII